MHAQMLYRHIAWQVGVTYWDITARNELSGAAQASNEKAMIIKFSLLGPYPFLLPTPVQNAS